MPIAFMPSRSVQSSNQSRTRGVNARVIIRGRVVSRSQVNVRNHLVVMITTVVSCVILSCFLIYDFVKIYQFFSQQNSYWSGDINDIVRLNSSNVDVGETLNKMENYKRQKALAATLMVMLILQAVAGVCVYVGFQKKVRYLLVGYLVLTFPVMTFAMVYAIIFMVDVSSQYIYAKIVTVVFTYTIQANMYRLVYRLYQSLKYDARRAQVRHGENNDGYNEDYTGTLPPVNIQLKPPPYEKEPPPYSVEIPTVSNPVESASSPSHSQISPPTPSRYSFSYSGTTINPSVFDYSAESLQQQPHIMPHSRLSTSSLSYHGSNRPISSPHSVGDLSIVEAASPPYSVSVPNSALPYDTTTQETIRPPYSISVIGSNSDDNTQVSSQVNANESYTSEQSPVYSVTSEQYDNTNDEDQPPPYTEM